MKLRNQVMLFAIVLLATVPALGQSTPPTPSDPPAAIGVPVPPDAPMAFSFAFDGNSYLGITPENISKDNMSQYGLSSPRGVGISSVSQGSPAERAGLKKGDVILEFDGEAVASTRKLLRLIGEASPDHTVRLTISRNGSEQQVNATLGKREGLSRGYRMAVPAMPRDFPRSPPAGSQTWSYGPELFGMGFGNNRRVGVTTTALTKQLADFFGVSGGHGLLISSVSADSPASKAGVRAGDVVTEVNGEKVEDPAGLVRALNRKEDGEVTLTIIRDKSQRTIKVTPERRQNPTFNLSDVTPRPMANIVIPWGSLMNLPEGRLLQSLSRIESLVMPKLEGLDLKRLINLPRTISVPRLMNLPRIEALLTPSGPIL